MDSDVEPYQAVYGAVTRHSGTAGTGRTPVHDSITGVPGTTVPAWVQKVLRQQHLRDIARFPYCPSGEIPAKERPL
jgi:hypothetical protein